MPQKTRRLEILIAGETGRLGNALQQASPAAGLSFTSGRQLASIINRRTGWMLGAASDSSRVERTKLARSSGAAAWLRPYGRRRNQFNLKT
jgi:hypothetical protein